MKAYIAVNARINGKVIIIAANEHDLNAADSLITAPVEVVFANAGYRGAEKLELLLGRVKCWFIAKDSHAVKELRQHPSRYKQALANKYIKARIRAKVEHPFRIEKF